jgi:ribosomal-protein-alanine acetyltransferase
LAHLDQVEQIEREAFASPWRREHFRFEIRENRYAVNHAVLLGDRVLAYACVWEIDEELKINNIAVRADMRRRGLGRWLLLRILEEARRRGRRVARLEVRPSNRAAIRLYRALGFHEVGRRKNYYQREGEDALVLEAPL